MLGALIGDIVGSRWQFRRLKTKSFPLLGEGRAFTDDSILTCAIADALLNQRDPVESIRDWADRIPMPKGVGGYGQKFIRWVCAPTPQPPYGSLGNGGAMRVSPVAMLADTLAEALRMAEEVTVITHNHPDGLKGALATVSAIWLARHGTSTEEIRRYVASEFAYDMDRRIDDIRPGYVHTERAAGSVPEAILCALEASSFEDALRNVVSLGGDADTQGAIAGPIAEALFGIPDDIRDEAMTYMPSEMLEIMGQLYRRDDLQSSQTKPPNLGDYLLFDGVKKLRHSSKRQAGYSRWDILALCGVFVTFFVGAIAFGMIKVSEPKLFCLNGGCGLKGERIAGHLNSPTESSYVLGSLWKYIFVLSPPKHIKEFPIGLNIENIFRGKWSGSLWNIATRESDFWRNQSFADVFGGTIKVIFRRQDSVTKIPPSLDSKVLGWRGTVVLPLRANTPSIKSGSWNDLPQARYGYWKDEGAQLHSSVNSLSLNNGLGGDNVFGCGFCECLHSGGSSGCLSNGIFHFFGLSLSGFVSPVNHCFGGSPQTSCIKSQEESDNGQRAGDIDHPPFRRRIFSTLVGLVSGFYLYDRGLGYFYDHRKPLSYIFITVGIFLVMSSIGLWLCSGFRWSWGWWI